VPGDVVEIAVDLYEEGVTRVPEPKVRENFSWPLQTPEEGPRTRSGVLTGHIEFSHFPSSSGKAMYGTTSKIESDAKSCCSLMVEDDKHTLKNQLRLVNSVAIFPNSATNPITIILTAPPGEYPLRFRKPTPSQQEARHSKTRNPKFNVLRTTRSSNPSEPFSDNSTANLTKLPSNCLDYSRLVPPSVHELDARRQEFQKIRGFLIEFLVVKGEELRTRLRVRVMDMYRISESEFPDDVVGRWKSGDETIEEGASDGELCFEKRGSYREQIRALEYAFRSQIRGHPSQPLETPHSPPRISVKRQRSEARFSGPVISDQDHTWNVPMIDPRKSTTEADLATSAAGFYMQGALSSTVSVNTLDSDTSRNTIASTNTASSTVEENVSLDGNMRGKGIFGRWRREKRWKGGSEVERVKRVAIC
jgi:hypothetical protein